jgi:hypothetical protein
LDRLPREDICSPGSEIYAKYVVKYEEREELAKSNVCHLSELPEVVSQFFARSMSHVALLVASIPNVVADPPRLAGHISTCW